MILQNYTSDPDPVPDLTPTERPRRPDWTTMMIRDAHAEQPEPHLAPPDGAGRSAQFVRYPLRLRETAAFRGLSAVQKLVLVAMMSYRNDRTGVTWVSAARIASDWGIAEPTVRRCVAPLEAAGMISVDRRPGRSPVVEFVGAASLAAYQAGPASDPLSPGDPDAPRRQAPGCDLTPAPGAAVPRRQAPDTPAPGAADPTPDPKHDPTPPPEGERAGRDPSGGGGGDLDGGGGSGRDLLARIGHRAAERAERAEAEARAAVAAAAAQAADPAGWAAALAGATRGVAAAAADPDPAKAADPDPAAAAASQLQRLGATPGVAAAAVAEHGPDRVGGWARYAAAAPGIKNPVGLVITRLRDGEEPPASPAAPAPAADPMPVSRADALRDLGGLPGIELVAIVRDLTGAPAGWPPATWTDHLVLAVWLRSSARRVAIQMSRAAAAAT